MPYAKHLSLNLSGTIGPAGAAIERFTFGVNMSDPSVVARDVYDAAGFADVVTDCTAFFSRAGSKISSFARLTEVKWARIGTDGRYAADPFIQAVDVPGGVSVTAPYYPTQISLAVSLNSAFRGPRGKGRFYLPMPGVFLGADSLITDADAAAVRASVATWLKALNQQPGVDGAAPKVTVASSFGENHDVTNVRVGRALDTMRSRRASLLERYSTSENV
jgi:hypothetical protein